MKSKMLPRSANLSRWQRLGFAGACVVVALLIVFASESTQECIDDYQHHYASDNPHGGLAPLGFMIGATYRCFGRFTSANVEVLIALFTFGLAVVTYKLWEATLELARDAEKAGEEQRTRMDASVREAVRAANAMESQVRKTDEIAQAELRAYVLVDSMAPDAKQGQPPFPLPGKYELIIKNFGQTPALKVRTLYLSNFSDPDESRVDFTVGPIDAGASAGMLGPGGVLYVSFPANPLPDELVEPVHKGRVLYYIYGVIEYQDIFGRDQRSTFRFRRNKKNHSISPCASGNEAT